MIKFLLTYWLGIVLFFAIFYWELSPISELINQIQTDFTTYLTSLTLPFKMVNNYNIIINNSYSLVIEKACNGTIPYLFFLASIVAFPSTIIHKIKWAIFGYFFIVAINTFRIWMIVEFVVYDERYFLLAHNYLGNILLLLAGLMLFIFFIKSRDIAR